MTIDIVLHLDQSFASRLDALISIARSISTKQDTTMTTLQDIVDKMAAETVQVAALGIFVKGLEDQIGAMPGMTPETQKAVDAIFAAATANTDGIMKAMIEPSVAPPVVVMPPVV